MADSLLSMSLDSIIKQRKTENKATKKPAANKGKKKENVVVATNKTGPVRGGRDRRNARRAKAAPYKATQTIQVTIGAKGKRVSGDKKNGGDNNGRWPRDRNQGKGGNQSDRRGDNNTRRNDGTKVLVSNLNFDIIIGDILELYQTVGTVKAATLNYRSNGKPDGSAEVVFLKRSDALRAIELYHQRELDGRPMRLRLIEENNGNIIPRSKRDAPAPARGNSSRQQQGRRGGNNSGNILRDEARSRGGRAKPKTDGNGRDGRKNTKKKEDISAESLDSEMEAYMKNKGK